jgi:hypothetical protein
MTRGAPAKARRAVGRELIDLPLFLEPGLDVGLPLEPTYQAACRGAPRR